MKIDVLMPKMGESVMEGTIIKWHKQKGDKIEKDEIIFEISTDKVDTEVPSPADGVLHEIKVFEQETVEVDTVVAVISTEAIGDITEENNTVIETEEEVPSTTQVGGETIDVLMPKMGESVMEGTIIKWNKKVGDKVEKDEILFEISTDKVDTEVPAAEEGILSEILVKEQETVEVDTVVAKITTSGGLVKQPINREILEKPSVAEKLNAETKVTKEKIEIPADRFYSPLVMNIANTENVSYEELKTIPGTGAGGRLTKKDLLQYIENRKSGKAEKTVLYTENDESTVIKKAAVPAAPTQASLQPKPGTEIIPMDNIRQRIMFHMVNSRDTSVHVTAVIEADMSVIFNFVAKNRNAFQEKEGIKLTYMPFISYSVIKALKEYPFLNASIDGNNIVKKNFINLGIAVAVEPNGLIVPNIKYADEKNIRGLARAINELSLKSRNKRLVPDDIMDGTFTITNYGVFGSLFGTPIINQPEVGILGVGAITKKPVVVEVNGMDTIAIKPMMYLSLSHDHRLVDGMLGGKFLKSVKDSLENFDVDSI